ncbi:hypothetical protein HAX54_038123 [Datura stramonium]|uniref:Uncharacterized protein n=1 Tax=Datura stramonium TaxID=4076 RepID=A0ABS8VLN8_DATST|nr:hypothetical protein [Datura stramonium]
MATCKNIRARTYVMRRQNHAPIGAMQRYIGTGTGAAQPKYGQLKIYKSPIPVQVGTEAGKPNPSPRRNNADLFYYYIYPFLEMAEHTRQFNLPNWEGIMEEHYEEEDNFSNYQTGYFQAYYNNDRCMTITMINGKTTIEWQIPITDSNEEENILDLAESRERHNPSYPQIEGRDAPPGQSNETRDTLLELCKEVHDARSLSSPGM